MTMPLSAVATRLAWYITADGLASEHNITLSAAATGAVAYGPMVALASAPTPATITAKVFRDPDYRTPVATVADLTGWGWTDRVNDAGGVTIEAPTATGNDIELDDLVRFSIDGKATFTGTIDEFEQVTVTRGEEVDYLTTHTGTGLLGLLSEAVVLPARGASTKPVQENRVFSWVSLDLDDSGWRNATVIVVQSDGGPEWAATPADWRDPTASWIWARTGTTSSAPVGWCYFRRTFTVGAGVTHLSIDVTIDNGGQVYFDGDLIAVPDNFTGVFNALVEVSAGTHLIAVSGSNPFDAIAPANPAGVLCTVWEADAEGTPTAVLINSDANWLIVEYPDYPPGMNVGEVVTIMLAEAQADDLLPGWELSFDGEVDSAGNPWADQAEIATKVGTDYRTFFLDELCGGGLCDMRAQPGGLVLDAHAPGSLGTASAAVMRSPADPGDPTTGNILDLTHRRRKVVASSFLVRWPGGWDVVDVVPDTRAKRATLGLGAVPSLAEVERLAAGQLDRYANIRSAITCRIRPQIDADTPYVGVLIGDTLTVPDFDGSTPGVRLLGISVAPDPNGLPVYTLELVDVIMSEAERYANALKKMVDGTLRGDNRVATPVSQVVGSTVSNCCLPAAPGGG